MEYVLEELNGMNYLQINNGISDLPAEEYALELVSVCAENDTAHLLFESGSLPDGFYDLKTGLAGSVLQKFSNYRIKGALIIHKEKLTGRFAEMALETNKGNIFRIFAEKQDALKWLLK